MSIEQRAESVLTILTVQSLFAFFANFVSIMKEKCKIYQFDDLSYTMRKEPKFIVYFTKNYYIFASGNKLKKIIKI